MMTCPRNEFKPVIPYPLDEYICTGMGSDSNHNVIGGNPTISAQTASRSLNSEHVVIMGEGAVDVDGNDGDGILEPPNMLRPDVRNMEGWNVNGLLPLVEMPSLIACNAGTWADDNLIKICLSFMASTLGSQKRVFAISNVASMAIPPPTNTTYIDNLRSNPLAQSCNLLRGDTVVFIRNVRAVGDNSSRGPLNHWVAGAVSGTRGLVFDSLGSERDRSVTNAWCVALGASGRCDRIAPPLQRNGDDCGFAALTFVRYIFMNGMGHTPHGGLAPTWSEVKFRTWLLMEYGAHLNNDGPYTPAREWVRNNVLPAIVRGSPTVSSRWMILAKPYTAFATGISEEMIPLGMSTYGYDGNQGRTEMDDEFGDLFDNV